MKYSTRLWLILGAAVGLFNLALGQTILVLSDTAKVQFALNQFQQELRRCKPGDIVFEYQGSISIDGQQQDWQQFSQTLNNILTLLTGREYLSGNPYPEQLGSFWDLEIVDPQLNFTSTNCMVSCMYRVLAVGHRSAAGTIEFQRVGQGWNMAAINGLIPFLNDEISDFQARQAKPLAPNKQNWQRKKR